jgi:hypothetical protein
MYGGTKHVTYRTRKYGGTHIFKNCFATSLRFQLQGMTSAAATAAILDITAAAILTPLPDFTGARGPGGHRGPGAQALPLGLRPQAPNGTVAHPPPIITVATHMIKDTNIPPCHPYTQIALPVDSASSNKQGGTNGVEYYSHPFHHYLRSCS